MAEHAHGASRWYRPPTPTLFESVEEELDALELEGLHLDPYDQDHAPPVYAADDDDDSEDDGVDDFDVNEDDMHAFGIPAARGWRLDARYVARLTRSESDTLAFAQRILDMFAQVLHLPGWQAADVAPAMLPLVPERVTLKRISGALTNAVFFVGYRAPDGVQPAPPTYLLRVYGAGSEALLSRRTELLILHTLSSLYEIGPHILGTFANGRIEEFYDCEAIGLQGMRDLGTPEHEGYARWIARRMRELHEVPLDVVRAVLEQDDPQSTSEGFGRGIKTHMMAASHRPRRRRMLMPGAFAGAASPSATPGFHSYSYYANPPSSLYANHNNMSTMSFDSLATSYDSAASPAPWPQAGADMTMSPLALSPSAGPVSSSRAPYPGVWRRLKRWTREASKVIALVNEFAHTPEGQAVFRALKLPVLPVTIQDVGPVVRADELGDTTKSLYDMLRCLLAMNLPLLCRDIDEYKQYVRRWERQEGKSRRVFCHNDSQQGNLLILKVNEQGELTTMASGMPRAPLASPALAPNDAPRSPSGMSARARSRPRHGTVKPHHRLVVIDFEYASPNPRAYDIANHFLEWCADYQSTATPSSLRTHGKYPTREERYAWLAAYVDQGHALTRRRRSATKLNSPDSLSAVSDMSLPPAVTAVAADCATAATTPPSAASTSPSDTAPSPHALSPRGTLSLSESSMHEVERLEQEVHVWTPAVHAVWGLWGIVIARDDIEALLRRARASVVKTTHGLEYRPPPPPPPPADAPVLFDNLQFSLGRIELFREDLQKRGISAGKTASV